jgi:hypothetical protein
MPFRQRQNHFALNVKKISSNFLFDQLKKIPIKHFKSYFITLIHTFDLFYEHFFGFDNGA